MPLTIPLHLVKEKKDDGENWYIDWDTTYLFPQLGAGGQNQSLNIPAVRGEIQDRNGKPLAVNGTSYEIGIVPGEMGDQKETIIRSSVLLSRHKQGTESIKPLMLHGCSRNILFRLKNSRLTIGISSANVTSLPSVQSKQVEARVYPAKEAAAHLIGYVGPITADELEKLEGKGYRTNDLIGKRGLEQVLDERLKGENGAKIAIAKEDGTEEVLAEKEVQNGENIQLTIDSTIQNQLYGQLSDQAGAATAIHPQTGETLGLVSAPSFDPNVLTLGATADQWGALENNPQTPLLNRFSANYAPGSVIKPITAAIALKEGTINPQTTIQVNGLQWQKDASWGNYYVTRVKDPNAPVDLEKALMYSDNIYFAQAALGLGKDKFINGLKGLRLKRKSLIFSHLEPSKTGSMDTEILLADSGYGQGEMEMNLVTSCRHLHTVYQQRQSHHANLTA